MKSSGSKWPTLIVVGLSLFAVSASAKSFDDQPHVLITVGHTNSAEWDDALGKYVATCDYKTLDGAAPRKGEACDGSPRLALSVEDLQSLRYITQANDHMEFVRRVYERFPKILFISAPRSSFNYGGSPERATSEPVNFRILLPPGVGLSDYDYFAGLADGILDSRESNLSQSRQVVATVFGPYRTDVGLGGTLDNLERRLPDFTLAFFYNNPDRATLTHELLHFLVERARYRNIGRTERLIELGKNEARLSYLNNFFNNQFIENRFDPKQIAYWDLMNLEYVLENQAKVTPEELEIAFFIAKYGHDLNLPSYSVLSHRNDFWKYVEEYRRVIDEVYGNPINGYAPESIIEPVNSNASYVLNGQEIPGFFKDYWRKIRVIANAYPKDLLGDENNVNRRNPRTIIDHFVVDIGPRNSTTSQR